MEQYCKGCSDKGSEICKIPSRTEVILRNVWRIAGPAIEGAAGASGLVFGGVAIPTDGHAAELAQQSIDAMHERVADCAAMHEDVETSLASL